MNIKGLFQKQKMMRTVLMALIPLALMAVYLFFEYNIEKRMGGFITCLIL